MEDIEAYSVPDCRAFYRTWYAPNNATLVIVGDVDVHDSLTRIRDAYGPIAPSTIPDRGTPPRPRQRAERRATLKWPTPTEKVLIGWHAPPHASFDHAVLEVIDELWTGGRSGRLRRKLVEELEIVSELRAGVGGLVHGGLFDLWISMREGVPVAKALEVVDAEVARLALEPVGDAELSKIKARIELYFLAEIETTSGKAAQIGFAETVAGDPAHAFTRLEELRRVSATDVQRVAGERLAPTHRSVVHVIPQEGAR
jgi:zinc protease